LKPPHKIQFQPLMGRQRTASNEPCSHPPTKRSKVETLKRPINVARKVLADTSHLPEPCKAMLIAMLPGTLADPAASRDKCQTLVFNLVSKVMCTSERDLKGEAAKVQLQIDVLTERIRVVEENITQNRTRIDIAKDALSTASWQMFLAQVHIVQTETPFQKAPEALQDLLQQHAEKQRDAALDVHRSQDALRHALSILASLQAERKNLRMQLESIGQRCTVAAQERLLFQGGELANTRSVKNK